MEGGARLQHVPQLYVCVLAANTVASKIRTLFSIEIQTKNTYKETKPPKCTRFPYRRAINIVQRLQGTCHNRFMTANKHRKKWTLLLVIREMQNKPQQMLCAHQDTDNEYDEPTTCR